MPSRNVLQIIGIRVTEAAKQVHNNNLWVRSSRRFYTYKNLSASIEGALHDLCTVFDAKPLPLQISLRLLCTRRLLK